MRRLTLLGAVVGSNFATVGLGQYVFGDSFKIAISNMTPVIFLMLCGPVYLSIARDVKRNLVAFLLFFNLCGWLSFLIFAFRFDWKPNVTVLFFQEIEILFSVLLLWWARRNWDEFFVVARFSTICSALISLLYGAKEVLGGAVLAINFGMDDKSQAAVLFCCQAFILIRYFGGLTCYLVAALLMFMAFVTISRLPVFFVPVILLAFAVRSRGAVVVVGIVSASLAAVAVSRIDDISRVFVVLDRLSSVDEVVSAGATSSHLLLLESGLQLKFTDALTFLFGSGPGNFAEALTSFPISIKDELNVVDPNLTEAARAGLAPMHSTPVSALLDYNILLFSILMVLLFQGVRFLIKKSKFMELAFFVTLFCASMFYSTHNKPYLFLLSTAIVILMLGPNDARDNVPLRAPRSA
jgi:hypothetical protein